MKPFLGRIPLIPGFPCPVSNSSRPSPHYRPGDGRRRSPALPAAPASPQTKHSAIHGSHLYREMPLSGIRDRIEIYLMKGYFQRFRELTGKCLIPIRLLPTQMKVTMKRYTRISQTHQYAQQATESAPPLNPTKTGRSSDNSRYFSIYKRIVCIITSLY